MFLDCHGKKQFLKLIKMPLYSFKEICPKIAAGVFIAPSADIIGKVILAENVSIWYQCVARGDVNTIRVGKNTNVQDLSMLHVTKDFALNIGENVSIGHSVTLHGCTIEDSCLIGMGATITDGAHIGANSIVAAGSLVPPGKKYPPKSMIMGNPAVVKRELTEDEIALYGNHYKNYVLYKDEYLNGEDVKLI
jgi:carbonic anhydrase/acetyltransferase-like protein (isoleucine patch superfamily)